MFRKQLQRGPALSIMEEGFGGMEKEDLVFIEQLLEARPQALHALLY